MEITPLGDSALLVRVVENFESAPDDALMRVLAAKSALEQTKIPGTIEITPAYTTLALFYDPVRAIDGGAPAHDLFQWLQQRVHQVLADSSAGFRRIPRTIIEIPVCYDDEFAPDLDEVASRAGIDRSEVVELHRSGDYRVHCVGFTPGFAYLGGLPEQLNTPRKNVPRKEIPAGSVAIGGGQTGIYPVKSPGGWQIIGRTSLRLFDPAKNPPALLQAGDRVRFRSITREEFERSHS
ncbi:MAG TPA: 5-oxoprolinase subunit PxpB [Chthoniobacterales bacterium]|nr:5-oxoprolinase subunit PxpB [Chthoniobacterales bacterium]